MRFSRMKRQEDIFLGICVFNAEFVTDMLKSFSEKYQFFKEIPPTIVSYHKTMINEAFDYFLIFVAALLHHILKWMERQYRIEKT